MSVVHREAEDWERFLRRLTVGALISLVGAEALALLGTGSAPHTFISAYGVNFVASAFLGFYIIYLILPKPRGELFIFTALGLAMEAVVWAGQTHLVWIGRVLFVGFGFGCAAFAGFLLRICLSRDDERHRAVTLLCLASFQPIFLILGTWGHSIVALATPMIMDGYAYCLDNFGGWQASFGVAGFVVAWHPLRNLVYLTYAQLSAFVMICHIVAERHPSLCYGNLVRFSFLVCAIGIPLFVVFPCIGAPILAPSFPQLPAVPLAIQAIPSPSPLPRNCIPSIHMAASLALYFTLRGISWRWWAACVTFLVLTAMGTLAAGGHYLIDLLTSVPLAVMTQALCCRQNTLAARKPIIVLGGLCLALILLSLRLMPDWLATHKLIFQVGLVSIAALCMAAEWRLFRAFIQLSLPAPAKATAK